ncbi:MAG: beta-lactamase family protein [Acidobacteria bacterium]|nr:beta-lactamase family protein [Acidobacteriota bacterium]
MKTAPLLAYCHRCMERRLFPGCAVAFGRSSDPAVSILAGRLTYQRDAPAVDEDTWFDLASLTKPIATVTAALRAVEQRRLDLETSLPDFFPKIILRKAQIRHLLSHSSGLSAYRPFFKTCKSGDEIIDAILHLEPEYATGSRSVYSDPGFILLGRLLEMAFHQPFRRVVEETVLEPLRLSSIQFGPLAGLAATLKIAPTELDFRQHGIAQGVAHDENARLFSGGAGHAGLFGTIQGVAQFARHILLAVKGHPQAALPVELLRAWTGRQPWLASSSWGLGWDTFTPESSAGPALTPTSFGHTGFTGTSMWIDPEQDIYICILSNRVHPSRKTEGMKDARREIHAFAVEALRNTK